MPHSTPRSPMIAARANGLHGEGYFSAYEVLDPTPGALARAADLTATAEAFERIAARYEACGYLDLASYNAERAVAYHDLARRAGAPTVQRTCIPTLGCADKRAAKKRDRLRAAAEIAEQIANIEAPVVTDDPLAAELDAAWERRDDLLYPIDLPAGVTFTPAGQARTDAPATGCYDLNGPVDDTNADWTWAYDGGWDLPSPSEVAQAIAEHDAEQVAHADDLDWTFGEGAYDLDLALASEGVWGDRLDAGDLAGLTISERPVGGTSGCTRPRDEAGRFVSTDPARIAAADARARILADEQARSWARDRRLALVSA